VALVHVASLSESALRYYAAGTANSELPLDHLALKKYLSYDPSYRKEELDN